MKAATESLREPTPASANVDPRERDYYRHLSRRWWDPDGPFWPLHRLNQLRSDYLRVRLAELSGRPADAALPLSGLRVLDVGCGGGILSESMARLGADVHGIDVVDRNIEIARIHAQGQPFAARYELAAASELLDRGVQYDAVLNMEVVEHVPDMAALMAECGRLVRPGGMMVVATINRTLRSWLFAIVGAEYLLRWLPRGTHRWRKFVKPVELQRLLEPFGFDVEAPVGVRINPVTRGFALGSAAPVNYMLLARRWGPPRNGPALRVVPPGA